MTEQKNWKKTFNSSTFKQEVLPLSSFFSHMEVKLVLGLRSKRIILSIGSCLNSPLFSVWHMKHGLQDSLLRTGSWQECNNPEMGFGEDLWCPQAHAAVMRLLDSELHLMEVMKKWMGQRAKSERDFSVQLHCMAAMVEKLERSQYSAGLDYISQLNKVRSYTQQCPVREGGLSLTTNRVTRVSFEEFTCRAAKLDFTLNEQSLIFTDLPQVTLTIIEESYARAILSIWLRLFGQSALQ